MEYLMVTMWDNTFVKSGEMDTYYPQGLLYNGITENNVVENTNCIFVNKKYKKVFFGMFFKITRKDGNRIYFKIRLDKELIYDNKYDNKSSGWYISKNKEQKVENNNILNNINKTETLKQKDTKEQLIDNVYQIIKDYREDENLMSKERIENWVNQFNVQDQEFILEELAHILKKRYISKEAGKILVKNMLEEMIKHLDFKNITEFLSHSLFLDHQPEGKSQKVLLKFLDEILQEEYSISLADCVSSKPKYYIYLDDVLCTGDTLFKALAKNEKDSKGWLYKVDGNSKSNYEIFKENEGIFILAYFAIHMLNIQKVNSRLYYALNKQNFHFYYTSEDKYKIENNIGSPDSKLDFIFPSDKVKNDLVLKCQNQIEEKMKKQGFKDEKIIYRDSSKPKTETLFTSPENRERFEKIILTKSIEIYNSSEDLKEKPRPKPLGYGLYTDVSFGFGALIFTWRNVPFNTPLVFWYPHHGWIPLFERKFVNYSTHKEISKIKPDDDYGEYF